MNNVDTQKVLDELVARDIKAFDLQDGDQVRLENGIYTAGEYEDGLGFDMTTENHYTDIPFYGEIYYAGYSYMVVRLHQVESEDCYSLIDLESLNSAFASMLDLKR